LEQPTDRLAKIEHDLEGFDDEYRDALGEYVRTHPDSLVGAYL
jgi:hypothetical protein